MPAITSHPIRVILSDPEEANAPEGKSKDPENLILRQAASGSSPETRRLSRSSPVEKQGVDLPTAEEPVAPGHPAFRAFGESVGNNSVPLDNIPA